MRHHKYEIEATVPPRRDDPVEGQPPPNSRPQIRRILERLCEVLDIPYDDLEQLIISYGVVTAIYYDRDADGEMYRNEFQKIATRQKRFTVDTRTFVGDERDI